MIDMVEVIKHERKRVEEARVRGELTRPSPAFLGIFIRDVRQRARWKQSTLADFAGVSVSTIERIERGEGASDEVLDRVAAVLGQRPGAFTALREPTSAEHTSEWLEQLARVVLVRVKPFRTHAQARELAQCDLFFIENSRLNEEHDDEVDNLRDWLGLASYCLSPGTPVIKDEPVKRRDLYDGALHSVQNLERAGVTVLTGTFCHPIGALGNCEIGAVVLFLRSADPGAVKRPYLLLDPVEFDAALKRSFSN